MRLINRGIKITTFGKLFPIFLGLSIFIGVKTYNFVMSPVRALHQAFEMMDTEKLQWAIEHGVDVDTFVQGLRPISLAFEKGSYEFMEILATAGATLNLSSSNGRTFLGEVTQKGDARALDILGENGADFHRTADSLGHNILTQILTESGDSTLLAVAMRYTKRNAIDKNGRTPLHYADSYSSETLAYLVTQGENPNAGGENGNTPLHAIRNITAAQQLVQLGADVNAINNCGTTPIFHQVGQGNGRMYEYLLQTGADVGRQDGYGHTILTYALMTENELLHRQVEGNFCEYYPKQCAQAKKDFKNTGIKALATVVYTKTIHKVAVKRLAASQAAKGAIKKAAAKAAGKRLLLKAVPIIGWASTAYDAAKVLSAVEEQNAIIREHKAEAKRLEEERKVAQKQLREEFLQCQYAPVQVATEDTNSSDTTAIISSI